MDIKLNQDDVLDEIKQVWSKSNSESTSPSLKEDSNTQTIHLRTNLKYNMYMYGQQQKQLIPNHMVFDMSSLQNSLNDIDMDIYINNLLQNVWGDQVVSRELQKILESGTHNQKELIVNLIERDIPQIAKDVFGNYVIQKVFEKCNDQLTQKLFKKLSPYFVDLSKNLYGCRVMQRIITNIENKEQQQNILIQALSDSLKILLYDSNGNYVLHKMLEVIHPQKIDNILPLVSTSFSFMIQQPYGCKIILKILEIYKYEQVKNIIDQVILNFNILLLNEGGNYIIQFMLKKYNIYQPFLRDYTFKNFYLLAQNKYASNTVEYVIETISPLELQNLVIRLTQERSSKGISMFTQLAISPSGNYVIKKIIILFAQKIQYIVSFYLFNQAEYNYLKSSKYSIIYNTFLKIFLKRSKNMLDA